MGANAALPRLVRFSGVLFEAGSKPPRGVVDVTFSLYRQDLGRRAATFQVPCGVRAGADARDGDTVSS